MKYKVGDRVRVREDLVSGREYNGFLFTNPMRKYLGREVVIKKFNVMGIFYEIEQDDGEWSWNEEMFEDIPVESSKEEVGSIEKDTSHYYIKNVDNTMRLIYNIIEVASETKVQAALMFNVLKYLIRWNRKDGLIDLKKAKDYLERLIEEVERENTEE